ncbi:MAG: 2Fe-2S iron-sulfur cluster-binding protein [Burkholderiaceae bacterium]
MSGYRLAAPHGAWLNRGQTVGFTFNGRSVNGFAGDTVASALLAQGIGFVGRSFKLHRPRGIFSCGVEEPSGLVDVGEGARRSANTRATDILARDSLVTASGNCWPSLEFDFAAINARMAAFLPAGFYYKTFMWPNWHLFEPVIRRMAGLGVAGNGTDPERYDEVSVNTDVLVVGAGLAGMQAAIAAARAGRQVMLLEGDVQAGGWIASQTLRPGSNAGALLDNARRALALAGVVVQTSTTAVALYDHRLVTAIETFEGAAAPGPIRERLWKIRAHQIVLATGSFERPMLFPDNDRPGVMLAGAVERYATHYGVACGKRVVIAAACDAAYGVAQSLVAAGMQVVAIVDRRASKERGSQAHAPDGVQVLHDSAIVGITGTRAVQAVHVAGTDGGGLQTLAADAVASAGGFTPNVNLYSQAGGTLTWREGESMFVPERLLPGIAVVGACAGIFDLDAALAHAEAVGRLAPGDTMPEAPSGGVGRVPADNQPTAAALAARSARPAKQFVDLQNDVTSADVLLAARENYRSVEHLKRYTTMGMATDQGKSSNVNALVLMGKATDRAPQQVGTTRFRPPFKPVTIHALVAGRTGERHRPLRQLSARAFHAARGALFEEFGGWERPAAYLLPGEDLVQAAERETLELRRGVGLFDGSPLGKIEVIGPDAAAFLDLMYVGTMSTLPVGGARYGVLLNENGIVFDDGIVARLAPDHFWVNTTSGGADRVVAAFEEWLQCEYTELRVFIVGMTSQWGNVTVSGPNAWRLLEKVGFDAALAPSVMKHMTLRDASVHGYAIRVLRASFNGELGYEINLPASRTEAMLEQLWDAGQDLGVGVYGIEALMIMRTEKGFIHVGADTDGTTLPADVGLARGVDRKVANFVGRRSLSRPAGRDADRLQLVGLLPVDRKTRLPVGAHLSLRKPPTEAEGLVTSSCFSPALQQPIALAMVKRGTERIGERLQAWYLGKMTEAELVRAPFFDPSGERLHG